MLKSISLDGIAHETRCQSNVNGLILEWAPIVTVPDGKWKFSTDN